MDCEVCKKNDKKKEATVQINLCRECGELALLAIKTANVHFDELRAGYTK